VNSTLLELTVDALPLLVDDIYAGRAMGSVVRNVLSSRELDHALEALAAGPRYEGATPSGAYTIGCMLAPTFACPSGPEFDRYLDAASAWDVGSGLPVARIDSIMSELAGRPCLVPRAPDGRLYPRGTIHVFPDGTDAPSHVDSYRRLPCLEHLEQIVDRTTQLSWYLPLSTSEAGGELILEGDAESQRYAVAAGDLVIFDGGRQRHRIATCHGSTPRRTFGGFGGRALDGSALYVWG
jgi:hypothetical protein